MALNLLVLVLAFASSHAQTPINTKGKTINGFKFTKDISSYRYFSIVMSDMLANIAATPPKFAKAKKTYETLKMKTDPAQPIKFYAQARLGAWLGQPFHELYRVYYGAGTYIDDFIGPFNDKLKIEVGLLWTMIGLAGNQLDNCKIFVIERTTRQSGGIGETEDTAGAYIGYNQISSLYGFHANVAANWKTCKVSVNKVAIKKLAEMRTEATNQVNTRNFTKWDGIYNEFWTSQITGFLRALLYRVGQQKASSQTRASYYLLIIAPKLQDQASVLALGSLLRGSAIVPVAQVESLVKKIVTAQTIPISDVFC